MSSKFKKKLEREKVLQQWAREDYYGLGRTRSINGLYNKYREIAQKKGRESVPTLHKGDLQKWKEAYSWDDYVNQREVEEIDSESEQFRLLRKRALNMVTVLTDDAVRELHNIITNPDSPATAKVRAIDMVLSRVIIQPKEDDSENLKDLPEPPAQDAPKSEKLAYIARVS